MLSLSFYIARNNVTRQARILNPGDTITHKTLCCANIDRKSLKGFPPSHMARMLCGLHYQPLTNVGETISNDDHHIYVEVLDADYWGESITEDQYLQLT